MNELTRLDMHTEAAENNIKHCPFQSDILVERDEDAIVQTVLVVRHSPSPQIKIASPVSKCRMYNQVQELTWSQ